MKHSNTTLNGSQDRLWLSFKNALRVNSGPLIALVVIYLAGALATSKFFTFSNQMSLLKTTSTTAITAFGLTFVLLLGGIDLSVGSSSALAGCMVALAAQKLVSRAISPCRLRCWWSASVQVCSTPSCSGS